MTHYCSILLRSVFSFLVLSLGFAAHAGNPPPQALLDQTAKRVSDFLDQFSQVKCTEHVVQEKLSDNGRVEFKDQSDYDYLVILANSGGELTLDESRYEDKDAQHAKNKKKLPLLITNGFATLFLVFHPYYQDSFEFTDEGEEIVAGHPAVKIGFHHIAGTRSPMALMLRGRDYPVELAGMAWVDKKNGNLLRAVADIPGGMDDVGLHSMHSEVKYSAVTFKGSSTAWWMPNEATIEVATQRQHWRNTHRFTDYKRFSVDTEEAVKGPMPGADTAAGEQKANEKPQ